MNGCWEGYYYTLPEDKVMKIGENICAYRYLLQKKYLIFILSSVIQK
jgi:hypothetical protein